MMMMLPAAAASISPESVCRELTKHASTWPALNEARVLPATHNDVDNMHQKISRSVCCVFAVAQKD